MIRVRLATLWALALIAVATPAFAQTAIAVNGIQSPNVVSTQAGTVATVVVTNGPGNTTDWIGLFPIGAADTEYLDWKYLNGSTGAPSTGLTSATIQQLLPVAPGDYELRLFASNGYQRLATSPTLAVADSDTALSINGVAPPGQATLTAGTSVSVGITNSPGNQTDWVGLFAVGAPDTASLDWRYLSGSTVPPSSGLTSATVSFLAPAAAGVFEIRYFTNDTYQRLASASFIVQAASTEISVNGSVPPATVTASAGTVASLTVGNGPGNATDWVGLYAVGAGHGQFVSWQYLNGATSAPSTGLTTANLTFLLPVTAGNYEFRFFANSSYQLLVTSSTVAIASGAAEISLNGHAFPTPVSTPAGSVTTASIAGGPGNATDWVGLYAVGAADTTPLDWRYLNGTTVPPATGSTTGAASFTTPVSAGDYEVRLFAANTYQRIVSSATISVPTPTAQISVNGTLPPTVVSVLSGSNVSVAVSGGPGNASDWVALAPVGAASSTYVAWQYLNGLLTPPADALTSATLSFPVPLTAGEYEFRLFVNGGLQRLATSTKVVSASPAVDVSLVSPTEGATFAGPPILLEASASTNSGSIASVSFYADGGLIESDTVAPFTASWTPSPGSHVLTATAVNTTGQSATSLPIHVTVGPLSLSAPVAVPSGGAYSSAQSVTLVAAPGATIRYTTNGSTPTASSATYSGPITISSSLVLKARAFLTGWSDSAVTTESYEIDAAPPTISASFSPAKNTAGWNNTPVTVSFSCSDAASGVDVCPAPITFNGQGAAQSVLATAFDRAGNSATTTVTVDVDFAPPSVSIITPDEYSSTTTTLVHVRAAVTDALADVAAVKCNGVVASSVSGEFVCDVTLSKGINDVVVQASDRAGNSRSRRVRVVTTGEPTSYAVIPSTYAMVVGQTKQLVVKDDFGAVPPNIVWSLSAAGIVEVALDGSVSAIGTGQVTVTATIGTASTTAELTVYAGPSLPSGTVRWSSSPRPGYYPGQVVGAGGPNGTAYAVVDVRYETTGLELTIEALIRGFNVAGEETYTMNAPIAYGTEIKRVIGLDDGVLLVTYDATVESPSGIQPATLVRTSVASGTSWRYELAEFPNTQNPAIAVSHDGTVFVREGTWILVIDGSTGQRKTTVFTPHSTVTNVAPLCPSFAGSYLADARVGDIVVDSEGIANVLVIRGDTTETHHGSCGTSLYSWSYDSEVLLYRINSAGGYAVTTLREYDHFADWPMPQTLLPDDQGGVLARWTLDCNLAGCGARAMHASTTAIGTEYALGDTGLGLLSSADHTAFAAGTSLRKFDIRTGGVIWTSPVVGHVGATLADGGVAVNVMAQGHATAVLDSNGAIVASNLGSTAAMRSRGRLGLVPDLVSGDTWIGFIHSGIGGIVAGVEVTAGEVGWAQSGGGSSLANAARDPYGIFVKGHFVMLGYKHTAVKIVPRNQQRWRSERSDAFTNQLTPSSPIYFATLGAGPHILVGCTINALLRSGINRTNDVPTHVGQQMEKLKYSREQEDAIIERLFDRDARFPDDTLTYECFPDANTAEYNSNSYAAGLLGAADLPLPAFPTPALYPGWNQPVPSEYFDDQP